jgi:hypothetical protein
VDYRDRERQPEKQYRQPASGDDALDYIEILFNAPDRRP